MVLRVIRIRLEDGSEEVFMFLLVPELPDGVALVFSTDDGQEVERRMQELPA